MKTYHFCPDRQCVTTCPKVTKRHGTCDEAATCQIVAEPAGEFKGVAHPGDTPYHTPIEMFSIAPETPAQLAEMRRRCPHAEFTDQHVPIAHNYQEKKVLLAAANFEDLG